MKALRITMRGCPAFQRVSPSAYLGYRVLPDGRIEHYLLRGRRVVRIRADCSRCVLGRLLRSSALLSMPVAVDGATLRFTVLESREVARLLEEDRSRLVSVEEIEVSELVLTEKQRLVLRIAADGAGASPSRIAVALGVSRQTAQRLFRRALRKAVAILGA